jgi:hypothetical protein
MVGRDIFLAPLLNSGKPMLEGVHVAWRSTSAFDSTFAWNACHSYLNRVDFRLFYQRHVRLFTGQNIRTSFGQSQKTLIERVLILEHYIRNKVFVSRKGMRSIDEATWRAVGGICLDRS